MALSAARSDGVSATTIAEPAAAKTVDLLKRNFAPQAHEIATACCGDSSYVRTWEGFTYVATVIDLASRLSRCSGHGRSSAQFTYQRSSRDGDQNNGGQHRASSSPEDRGCQYTAAEFRRQRKPARHRPIALATTTVLFDNAVAESFFSTLKEELLYRRSWPTRTAARQAVFEYIEVFYNRQRMHSALDYLSPVASEAEQREARMTERAS